VADEKNSGQSGHSGGGQNWLFGLDKLTWSSTTRGRQEADSSLLGSGLGFLTTALLLDRPETTVIIPKDNETG
jgi:hypothetical protein